MQPAQEHTSLEYILSFQRGEERGFDWAFREFYPSLTFFANKITGNYEAAEEIASTAFIKIWKRHGHFSAEAAIKTYLYRIVYNDALQFLRQIKKEKQTVTALLYLRQSDLEVDHFHHLASVETSRLMKKALESLPPACSEVFYLLYEEGKSVKETARILELSPNTVKAQRRKGLAILRKRLASFWVLLTLTLQFLFA